MEHRLDLSALRQSTSAPHVMLIAVAVIAAAWSDAANDVDHVHALVLLRLRQLVGDLKPRRLRAHEYVQRITLPARAASLRMP